MNRFEAGRTFAQLQDAGMKTVKLEEIVRQKDPELKQTVEQLARGRQALQDASYITGVEIKVDGGLGNLNSGSLVGQGAQRCPPFSRLEWAARWRFAGRKRLVPEPLMG